MTNYLYFDLETRSTIDIKKSTVDKYVNDKDFKIILVSYAINDSPVKVFQPYSNDRDSSQEFLHYLKNSDCRKVIHNSAFDCLALKAAGVYDVPLNEIIDTAVQARAHGLPASLSNLSKLYDLADSGKKSGTLLINNFCKINKKLGRFKTKEDDEKKWNEFVEYARSDVIALREIFKLLPNYNYPDGREFENWILNEKINRRGFRVDVEFVNAAVTMYERFLEKQIQLFKDKLGFSPTQNIVLLDYLKQFEPSLTNVQAKTLENIDNEKINDVLELKRSISNVTPKKYISLQNNVVNERIRGTLTFMGGARTGRDSGKLFQPQNLKRPTLFKDCKDDVEEDLAIENVINQVKQLKSFGNDGKVLSEVIRNVIIPSEGNKLIVCDLSNIEGRTLSYLAREYWKINYFKKVDSGEIPFDNYIMTYAKTMGIKPENVTKEQRSIGKVMELSLGYGGGVQAFCNFFNAAKLSYQELYEKVIESLTKSDDVKLFNWYRTRATDSEFLTKEHKSAISYLIKKWRLEHPAITFFLKQLEVNFVNTVKNENYGRLNDLVFFYENDFLNIKLPSGRILCYYQPHTDLTYIAHDARKTSESFTKTKTFGGKLAENVASAMARDVLYNSLKPLEENGYKTVMLVHDEVIVEAPDNVKYSHEYVSSILTTKISWAQELPLSAAGFECYRYKGK